MKIIKEFIIKNNVLAKIKILWQLFWSSKYIVIAVKDKNSKSNVTVDFQFSVTNDELKFYTNYLSEFVTNTTSIVDNANRIISTQGDVET